LRKKYSNMDDINNEHSFKEVIKWLRNRSRKKLDFQVRQHGNKRPAYLNENRSDTTVTWIGHSTFFIQQAGINMITDPVWAGKMGISKRLTAPGLTLEEVPQVDIVLISHSHYDHLHFGSIRKLRGNPVVLVPEGLGRMFRRRGFDSVRELPWWGKTNVGKLEFHFVPAQHWTRRTLWDTNSSHWGGWVIRSEERDETIYFAGDSGYFRGFAQIGQTFKINTAILPIGAYDPVWFMHISHMTPEEAVQAYLDLGADVMIPMHYGTFMLADDTPEEALTRLKAEWNRRQLNPDELKILELGETILPGTWKT